MPGRPAAQLRWAVGFAQLDLNVLSIAEREALGHELHVLVPGDWKYEIKVGALADEELRSIHATFRSAIQILLGKEGRRWALPSQSPCFLIRERGKSIKKVLLFWEGDEADAIVRGFVNLLVEAGSRLRSCAECGAPLVARKGQIYCSTVCSQKTRNRRMRGRDST